MKEKINNNSFNNFSNGKYSYHDYLKVREYFNNPDENKESTELLKQQWNELTTGAKENNTSLNHLFEKIQYKILLEEKKQEKKKALWHFYSQAAAILLIPVTAFFLWFYLSSSHTNQTEQIQQIAQSWVEINAPEGARVKFLLPDSTSGWLNSGSKLKYPAVFDSQRKVELEGEAYFEVSHRNKSNFVVEVADMDVKVLGTKFNVSAYSDDSFTNVVLAEGKVEIFGKTGVFQQILLPNEKITFNRDLKSVSINGVDAKRISAWKDGYLVIENERLGDVIPKIERWYNTEIVVADKELCNYRFKATFRDEPLEEILKLMAITTPIKYRIEKREQNSDGIIMKRKVLLELKK
jgi:ferric-dicitrate binding protein FerR (iron transport regulator)